MKSLLVFLNEWSDCEKVMEVLKWVGLGMKKKKNEEKDL